MRLHQKPMDQPVANEPPMLSMLKTFETKHPEKKPRNDTSTRFLQFQKHFCTLRKPQSSAINNKSKDLVMLKLAHTPLLPPEKKPKKKRSGPTHQPSRLGWKHVVWRSFGFQTSRAFDIIAETLPISKAFLAIIRREEDQHIGVPLGGGV